MGASKNNKVKIAKTVEEAAAGEKVSVNMNTAALAQIDLLVDQGYYFNRSSFINEAVNRALEEQRSTINRIVEQKQTSSKKLFFMGITVLDKNDMLEWKEKGEKQKISGYGMLILDTSCDDLILETVESIRVVGKVYCSERIRKAYLPNL